MPYNNSKRTAGGAGTIRKKTFVSNGKEYTYWEARYTSGYDPGTGKQIQRTINGKSKKEVAEKLLPYVTDDLPKALRIYEETRDNAQNSGYDLRPENMKTVTVYIIRTDLQ